MLVRKRHRVIALRNAISDLRLQRPHVAGGAPSAAAPLASSGLGLIGVGAGAGRSGGSQATEASSGAGVGDIIRACTSSMRLDEAPPTLSAACSVVTDEVLAANGPAMATPDPPLAGEGQEDRGCDMGDHRSGGVLL